MGTSFQKKKTTLLLNPYLIGRLVYLRPVEKDDAVVLQQWHNDPHIRTLSRCGGLPVSRASEEEDIEAARAAREVYLLIVRKASNKPLGFVRTQVVDAPARTVWLRFVMGHTSAWGRGYAREALTLFLNWLFSEQNARRVTLETYSTNKRAITFFKRIGFTQEGVLRQALYVDGQYLDIIAFGLLKHEFKTATPN
jgi:RimJ/RimL family protein N-acetyltransferase